MKIIIPLVLFAIISSTKVYSQLEVGFHQSFIPFIGVNYEVINKLRPEFRIGTDRFFEDVYLEFDINYTLKSTENYDFYAGLGVSSEPFPGMVIPFGMKIYPFERDRNFGFHIELSPIFTDDVLLRGSWGIRYKFE